MKILIPAAFWILSAVTQAAPDSSQAAILASLRAVAGSRDLVEIKAGSLLAIDLKYASADNFMGRNFYGPFDKAYLHRIASTKLGKAAEILSRLRPGCKLVIFDALRPRSIQRFLWSKVVGTERERYVANPETGSMHNYGFAVDLSILGADGKPLDMGTAFDDFSPLSQPQLEEGFLKEGKLHPAQVENRRLLREVMEAAGFLQLKLEWWHFDALPKADVKANYPMVE